MRHCAATNSSLARGLRGTIDQYVNAFLDDGSDSNYSRDDIISALGLDADEINLRLSTLSDSCVPLKNKKVPLTIKSIN